MKKTLIIASVLALSLSSAHAQFGGGFGGFGGFQMPKVELQTSQEFKDVNYAGDEQVYHNMDIYLPKQTQEKYPVVVHIYGSAWSSNNSKGSADLGTIVDALLKAGYAVVCPNHRSISDAQWPAQINDIKAVIRFIRGNAAKYKFDTSFIATSGFSSGGHLSSCCATTNGLKVTKVGVETLDLEGNVGKFTNESSIVNAACDWSGPVDLTNMDCGEHMSFGAMSPEANLLGGAKLSEQPDKFRSLSATYYVNKNTVPLIVFHGMKDNVVPCCQGQKLYDLLKGAGVKTELTLEPEGGHGMGMYSETNLQKMVNFLNDVRKNTKAVDSTSSAAGKSQVVEDGGTGAYKAIMKEEASLPAHTIFVPQDLSKFNAKNPLPVLVWGNGACTNSPWEHYKFLNEIASQGYLVLATGFIPIDGKSYRGPQSTSQQQIESIDWAFSQNADKSSPLYGKIDLKHIAIAGMSCGGLQTLFNCADKRISTIMICNSGLFTGDRQSSAVPGMPMPPKEKLKEIKVPIIYILGGEKDIAYGNGMDDFHRIDHVPAFAANFPVGHGGTYSQPHGGEFSIVATAWLQWQCRGDKTAAKMFQGTPCQLSQRKDWTIEKNKLIDK
ncbi:MAG: prolyl oligopeptidase family serine peptidase [Prevotellaceae bacterium]|nr:prolyl oligopeptidase family serine peptidase [Candidatus Colivivens equi]